MPDEKLALTDTVATELTPATTIEARVECIVLQPIFKNGRLYSAGQTIMLDPATAELFIQLKDVAYVTKPTN